MGLLNKLSFSYISSPCVDIAAIFIILNFPNMHLIVCSKVGHCYGLGSTDFYKRRKSADASSHDATRIDVLYCDNH